MGTSIKDPLDYIPKIFPNVRASGFKQTSEMTPSYNCIAYAAGDTNRWWEPLALNRFWPDSAPQEMTIDAYVKAFESVGFQVCDDSAVERGYQKIALYADAMNVPTHAARQLPNGRWKSKLGKAHDIEHAIDGLQGQTYGHIVLFMKKPAVVAIATDRTPEERVKARNKRKAQRRSK